MKYPTLPLFLFISIFSACHSTKDIQGSYVSNFASLGFFVTRLKLDQDSSFQYVFRGDLLFDSETGHFKISKKRLLLFFDPKPYDTSSLQAVMSPGFRQDSAKFVYKSKDSIQYYLKPNKLLIINTEGKIVRNARRYSKRKKYLLFGSHYYRHRHYLKKIKTL